jgi:dihydrofolate reductase
MLVSLIVGMDRRGLIGDYGGLPWHLPKDLRRFKAITWGKPIVMGRRTFESIGKPLPGRFNIVLSQNPAFSAPGCHVVRTFPAALSAAQDYLATAGGDEIMVIGGGKVYAEAIGYWDRLYLTVVEGEFEGKTYFPIHAMLRQSWRLIGTPETHPPDEKNPHRFTFYILERIRDTASSSPQPDEDHSKQSGDSPETALEGLDLAALLAQGHAVR